MTAVKYPSQWAVIKLGVKRELIKGFLELMFPVFYQFFYIIMKYEVFNDNLTYMNF